MASLGRSQRINLGWCHVVVLCVCSVQSLMLVFASVFLINNTWAVSTAVIDRQGTLLTALIWWASECVWSFEWNSEPDRERMRKREVICDVWRSLWHPPQWLGLLGFSMRSYDQSWCKSSVSLISFECIMPGAWVMCTHVTRLFFSLFSVQKSE